MATKSNNLHDTFPLICSTLTSEVVIRIQGIEESAESKRTYLTRRSSYSIQGKVAMGSQGTVKMSAVFNGCNWTSFDSIHMDDCFGLRT